MQLFYLDHDPENIAKYHCDIHLNKQILETAQMLSTAHRIHDSKISKLVYRKTHENHPTNVWIRSTKANYEFAYNVFDSLCCEYIERFLKIHLTCKKLLSILKEVPSGIADGSFTHPPQAINEVLFPGCRCEDTVEAYRKYYIAKRKSWVGTRNKMTWTERSIPHFMK